MSRAMLVILGLCSVGCASESAVIVCPKEAGFVRALAAREVQRYVYQRTGGLLSIVAAQGTAKGDAIVIAVDKAMPAEQFTLKTQPRDGGRVLTITGGSDVAALYGAYRFAEKLGVRFYLDGDVLPDDLIAFAIPDLDETHKPLFELRGIQPFHDFPEGPDWWNADDYKAYFSQLAKLRMNWFGLHCYPEGGVGPEPGVWIGLAEDANADGTVKFSSPSRWASTMRDGAWGNTATPTGKFAAGASLLFETDAWGPDVHRGHMPEANTPAGRNEVFNRTAAMFKDAFSHGRALGIKFALGTETPLTIPTAVQERLKEKGLNPKDPNTVRKLYEGMFTRIARCHPLDYYWLWTAEGWTWGKPRPAQVEAVKNDFKLALEALENVGKPFGFATCGWVLGPPDDRALFDKVLPKSVPISCINQQVGFNSVEPGFKDMTGRGKWAIPWMEDDPALTIPQLWAGRMRRDAADALAYGCTGLMGIHWRTKVLSPNVSALAKAAWDQSGWNPSPGKLSPQDKRDMPCADFYADWCRANFGAAAAAELAAMFTRLDGGSPPKVVEDKDRTTGLPRPATWIDGPGGIEIKATPWEQEKARYAFVEEMAALRPSIKGAGNLERFDYWLNTFRYLRAVGRIGCMRGELDGLIARIDAEKDAADKKQLAEQQALPLRLAMARQWEEIITLQLAATDTPGEMGTIANLEHHAYRQQHIIDAHDGKLAALLGQALPAEANPTGRYLGQPRIIVPTTRSRAKTGEKLAVKVIVLDNEPPAAAALHWRSMGKGEYREIGLTRVARGVYTAELPPAQDEPIEYYITATTAKGKPLAWPAGAPRINQTVVVMSE
jgi:hypothetical protein